jgi:hypothetical protein
MARYVAFGALTLTVAAAWMLSLPPPAVTQPLAFTHAKHDALACAVCHRGVDIAARAAIPQGDLCLKCHATAPRIAGAEALWDPIAEGQPIDWVRLTRVPDHVMFSHRRHVTLGGLECESCHGDIGRRPVPAPSAPVRLDMDACLSCHRRERASEDCAACHR